MSQSYLVEMSEREHEACRRLVQMPFLSEGLFGSLGLQSSFSWFILQIRKDRMAPSLSGDVDILAGPLSWTDRGAFDALVSEERANATIQVMAEREGFAQGLFSHLLGYKVVMLYLGTVYRLTSKFLLWLLRLLASTACSRFTSVAHIAYTKVYSRLQVFTIFRPLPKH